ncbi:hypothetical protein EYF80_067004 [Liparis tanakae]|uniref:Uncharacterized protein n=1 Tax=Liparis tanakae TaxID=230148 RepID=A0A4Z2E2X3_9TELE|nr:hypothetical protein EYF80_067004 [Liparis tanakae]
MLCLVDFCQEVQQHTPDTTSRVFMEEREAEQLHPASPRGAEEEQRRRTHPLQRAAPSDGGQLVSTLCRYVLHRPTIDSRPAPPADWLKSNANEAELAGRLVVSSTSS